MTLDSIANFSVVFPERFDNETRQIEDCSATANNLIIVRKKVIKFMTSTINSFFSVLTYLLVKWANIEKFHVHDELETLNHISRWRILLTFWISSICECDDFKFYRLEDFYTFFSWDISNRFFESRNRLLSHQIIYNLILCKTLFPSTLINNRSKNILNDLMISGGSRNVRDQKTSRMHSSTRN